MIPIQVKGFTTKPGYIFLRRLNLKYSRHPKRVPFICGHEDPIDSSSFLMFLELTPWIGNIEWNSKCFVSTGLWLCKSMATFEKSHQNKISADRMIYLYAVADLHLSAYQNAFFLFILSSLSPCSSWFLSHSLHLLSLFLCFSYSCFAYYVWFLISCLEVGGRCELQHFLSHVNPKFSRVTELSLVVLILIPRLIQK